MQKEITSQQEVLVIIQGFKTLHPSITVYGKRDPDKPWDDSANKKVFDRPAEDDERRFFTKVVYPE